MGIMGKAARKDKKWYAGGAAGLALCMNQVAWAQQTPENETIEPLQTALITTNELIVYGQKTERPLQDVDTSVGLLTGLQIEQDAAVDLYDVLDRIANVNPSLGGLGFAIRGIDL